MPATSRLTSKPGRLASLSEATRRLMKQELLVGIPDTAAERTPEPGKKGTPPSNATLGFLNEFGDDELHIPPRPFLYPGVANAKPAIVAALQTAGSQVLTGDVGAVDRGYTKAGLASVVAVKEKMMAGPFAPLSDRTIEARAERHNPETGKLTGNKSSRDARGFLKLRAQGTPDDVLHDAGLAQPLLDTRSLFTSIQFVVRDKS